LRLGVTWRSTKDTEGSLASGLQERPASLTTWWTQPREDTMERLTEPNALMLLATVTTFAIMCCGLTWTWLTRHGPIPITERRRR
jgi:hypothetical protein